ncbi:hypothetical protein M2322_004632 [Rhodoblastus acidophilus]|uniref:hypothetical protein n=1 Tax=Rhodoblastus acidophilus TaxID=1074 RepID=UPI0022259645|nr:hypothetical protein [Rhodoblastus acidophilus]MCW2319063.1 hypothetical protein [Rhodoblastus acidophilus]
MSETGAMASAQMELDRDAPAAAPALETPVAAVILAHAPVVRDPSAPPGRAAQDQLVQAIADAVGHALAARAAACDQTAFPPPRAAGEASVAARATDFPSSESLTPGEALAPTAACEPHALLRKVIEQLERAGASEPALENRQPVAGVKEASAEVHEIADAVAEAPAERLDVSALAPRIELEAATTAMSAARQDEREPSPSAPAQASLSPTETTAPLSLERLDMLGPGLRWRLAQLGYPSLNALASADPDALRARLGEIGRLVNVKTWIEAARSLLAETIN